MTTAVVGENRVRKFFKPPVIEAGKDRPLPELRNRWCAVWLYVNEVTGKEHMRGRLQRSGPLRNEDGSTKEDKSSPRLLVLPNNKREGKRDPDFQVCVTRFSDDKETKTELVPLGMMWENTAPDGTVWYSGPWMDEQLVLVPNMNRRKETAPDYFLGTAVRPPKVVGGGKKPLPTETAPIGEAAEDELGAPEGELADGNGIPF